MEIMETLKVAFGYFRIEITSQRVILFVTEPL